MLAGAHSVVQVPMRGPVDGPVCSLLHGIVCRSVRRFVPLHSVVQLATQGTMTEAVSTSVYSSVRQPVHQIVQAFVHDKMDCTEGFKDALMHSVVH